jgi:hypothetical protein
MNFATRTDNLVGFRVDKLPTLMGKEHANQGRK